MKQNKYSYVKVIQVSYDSRIWEDVCEYDKDEYDTCRHDIKEYRESGYGQYRVISRRVLNESYQ